MDARFGTGVKKVMVVETGDDGRRTVTTVYEKSRPKKNMTPSMKGVESVVTGASSGLRTFAEDYMERHQESNRRKSDGWVRDFPYNVYCAVNKAAEKLRIYPIPVPYAETQDDDED